MSSSLSDNVKKFIDSLDLDESAFPKKYLVIDLSKNTIDDNTFVLRPSKSLDFRLLREYANNSDDFLCKLLNEWLDLYDKNNSCSKEHFCKNLGNTLCCAHCPDYADCTDCCDFVSQQVVFSKSECADID